MRASELPWGKLDRAWLAEQAQSDRLPDWQRVALACWHRVGYDGLARFREGELAELAGRVSRATGETRPVSNPRRALREAIAHGWLAAGSTELEVRVSGYAYGVGRMAT